MVVDRLHGAGGKSSWSPWNGLVRGIAVSFRWEIKWFFVDFEDKDDSECVVRRSLAT